MNKKIILLLIMVFGTNLMINAKPGCLSNSYELKQKYDPKEYHEVICYCPCDYWAMRGLKTDQKSQCLQCGHAHNPGPNPFVPGSNKIASRKQSPALHAKSASLEKMIVEYKARK